MSQYASLTVAQLKDVLKEKNLPTDGKKADLLARLTETESTLEADEKAPEAAEAPQEPAQEENGENSEHVEQTEEKSDAPEENGADEKPAKPEKKVLTPEERKQLAVDLLTKKIKRAEKFGDETSAVAARKDLARVEKFGVDPSTALGKEIGALDKDVNSELGMRSHKKKGKPGKGKVQKK